MASCELRSATERLANLARQQAQRSPCVPRRCAGTPSRGCPVQVRCWFDKPNDYPIQIQRTARAPSHTSASRMRSGSTASVSTGLLHCSLCLTDPWISLHAHYMTQWLDGEMIGAVMLDVPAWNLAAIVKRSKRRLELR